MNKHTPEYVYGGIETAPMSGVVDPHLREKGMGARTKAIRKLLKTQGIKGVSVRQSTGSMCFWTYVDIPRLPWAAAHSVECDEQTPDLRVPCINGCPHGDNLKRERNARARVEAIILAAFPDLDDRSDAYNGLHSDFVFMVGFQ